MTSLFLRGCLIFFILLILSGGSLSKSDPIVNLMIAVDSSPNPTQEQLDSFAKSLRVLVNEIDMRKLNATIYVSGDAAIFNRLPLTYLGESPNHEMAVQGSKTDEEIASMPYLSQENLLKGAKKSVEKCYICGGKSVIALGFMPQSFNQNEDTYKALEESGIKYDAGFESGLLYLPSHEKDVWPYTIDNHKLIAVPISTYSLSGKLISLDDRVIEKKGLSSAQWYNMLIDKFDQSAENGEPIVVIFSNFISGTKADYLDVYKKFIDYAVSKNAKFVTTIKLVDMAKEKGLIKGASVSASDITPTGCIDCSKSNEAGNIKTKLNATITSMGNASRNCTTCNGIYAELPTKLQNKTSS